MSRTYIKPLMIRFAVTMFVLATLLSVICFILLRDVRLASEHEHTVTDAVSDQLAEMKLQVVQIQQYLTDSAATGEQDGVDDGAKALAAAEAALREVERLSPSLAAAAPTIHGQIRALYDTGVSMVAAYRDSREAGNRIMKAVDGFDARSEALQKSIENLSKAVEANKAEALGAVDAGISRALWVTLVLSSLLCIAAAIAGVHIYRTLMLLLGAEPAVGARLAEKLTQGDLASEIRVDEVSPGSLLAYLARMRARWLDVLQGLRGQFMCMASAATQVSSGASALADNCSRQHAATQAIAASIEQLSSSIDQLASDSSAASEQVELTDKTAAESMDLVRQVQQQIQQAADTVGVAARQMSELDARAKQIVGILATIKGIADQTNLLALNAAIEAARAGESGRGFAVVADEVRSLAQRSAASTHSIGELVADVHSVTSTVVATIGEGVGRVQIGVERSHDVLGAMEAIQRNAQVANNDVQRINAALQMQRDNMLHISENLFNIADLTEQNSAAATQLSAAAGQLENNTRTTEKELEYFKVGGSADITLF